MPEITLKVSPEQFNMIQAAISAYVAYNQQHAAILANTLQSQFSAQIQPVTVPASAV